MLQQFDERNRDLIVNVNGVLTASRPGRRQPVRQRRAGRRRSVGGLAALRGSHIRTRGTPRRGCALPPWRLLSRTFRRTRRSSQEIRRTLAANRMKDGVHIRLTLTRGVKITSGMDPRLNRSGPTLIVLAEHKPPVYSKQGLRLITSSQRRSPPDCLDPKIHHANLLSSILAKIQANAAGVDDAVMLDLRGFIAETNATHLFMVARRRCPHADAGGLPGRHHARDHPRYLPCTGDRVRGRRPDADGAVPGRRGVLHRHHGRTCGRHAGRRPEDRRRGDGPMTRRLSALFAERTATDGTRVVD